MWTFLKQFLVTNHAILVFRIGCCIFSKTIKKLAPKMEVSGYILRYGASIVFDFMSKPQNSGS